jgi:hypothetical protein
MTSTQMCASAKASKLKCSLRNYRIVNESLPFFTVVLNDSATLKQHHQTRLQVPDDLGITISPDTISFLVATEVSHTTNKPTPLLRQDLQSATLVP